MSQKEHIVIRGYGSVSPLGFDETTVAESYRNGTPAFQYRPYNNLLTPVGALPPEAEEKLRQLAREKKAYQTLDKSVLMAVYAARLAIIKAGWQHEKDIAVNLGSSRGATTLFENYLAEFVSTGSVPAPTSPVTTLGNISSWVANDLQTQGAIISHSVTCSTALQAIANGFAWLKSGMATHFLAGGAEAPLTPFTVAQMKAIGIYADDTQQPFPCRPHNPEKKNTFVLGEAAAVFALEKVATAELLAAGQNQPICIEAVGFGFETIKSKTGISKEGHNFEKAIQDALHKAATDAPVDLVIMHAPGTVAGDSAEMAALKKIFAKQLPHLTSNKFLMGHTLGASAATSLEYACYILKNQHYLPIPSLPVPFPGLKQKIRRILITAAGFGGNATAILVAHYG